MSYSSSHDKKITIEVVYGLPHKQTLLSVTVNENETIEQSVLQSGIISEYPEIDLNVNKVGIWSRAKKWADTVKEGDRIEIYRPLVADPKEIRRRRAEKAKEEGRADKVTGGRPNQLRNESSS